MHEQATTYRTYWVIWGFLLVLTLAMFGVEAATFPRVLGILVLLLAMFVKASLIGGWFMHLRYERLSLVLIVVLGTLITAAFLYFLIAPDGSRALELAP